MLFGHFLQGGTGRQAEWLSQCSQSHFLILIHHIAVAPVCMGSSGFAAVPILGVIFGSVFGFVLLLVLILCCACPCCLIYQCCRKRPQQIVTTTNHVVNVPMPVQPPHPSYPGYQPVPGLHGYGGQPGPTAPPHSYMEGAHPAYSPVQFPPGQPMNHLPPPVQFYPPPPPYSDDRAQSPYNPSFSPKA